ncbi:hypothetical protein O0L34_g18387 [Tuta absoluta]|nr:hypothetical protein O0L34_g18387 [Tuta absoluta]
MDLLKTPSVQSLLDSDLESVDGFPYLDIEELDEVEYALPASEAPTLAEVLSADDEELEDRRTVKAEPTTCSALQADFLQAVSQQLLQAQERSAAGAVTTLGAGREGKLTVGTAHGHLLSFQDQILRWVCDSNTDRGAVSCLAYNHDSTRLLAGYARGLICQYESIRGLVLRRVTLGCDIWGTLRVTWAGTSGLALDTGGSVWLIKFSRPLGVRSARISCLFSGARGEVVAMAARDARVLAMATLSRVIIVAGGRASGVRLGGPSDILPVIEWCQNDDRVLVCARARILQWLSVNMTGSSISLRPMQRVELKSSPLWLGWLGGSLAIFDVDENLRLYGEDYDKPLDLSYVEPVYASAFFKGLWTDGRVSQAMGTAGASALGGIGVSDGAFCLLGRKGVVRVRPRDLLARAQAFLCSGRHGQALRLLCATKGTEAKGLATRFIAYLSERPHVLSDKQVADLAVKLCLKYKLGDELWYSLWDNCLGEKAFVEALGDAAVRGELSSLPPSPDSSQALIEKLAEFEPGLVERVVASLPLTSLDPHRASVFTRERKLWRGVGAIAAALGGSTGAMRELIPYVDSSCAARRAADPAAVCACAGGALLLAAADALAGRGAGGRPLPDHAQHAARHDALLTLLAAHAGDASKSPLRIMVEHDAAAAARLLEQSARDPPFAGPLGKQNRLRVARALMTFTKELPESSDRVEILEFIAGQIGTGALPPDQEVVKQTQQLAAGTLGERSDRAWRTVLTKLKHTDEQLMNSRELADGRPRVLWKIDALLNQHENAILEFFRIETPSTADINEFFDYLQSRVEKEDGKRILEPFLTRLVELRPVSTAAIMNDHFPDSIAKVLSETTGEPALKFAEHLLDTGRLKGDAAAAYFSNLCVHSPSEVTEFLTKNPGIIRPEDALAIVKEKGLVEAEPICLEATGDLDGALDAILRLVESAQQKGDKETEVRLVERACHVLSRVAPSVPPATAADMWSRLLRRAAAAPPTLLLDAAAYLPLADLIDKTCNSPRVALTLLECAAQQRHMWSVATRVAGGEAHAALARALRVGGAALPVRGDCARCGGRLDARPKIRTAHCGRAFHADCEMESHCGTCGRQLPDSVFPLPSRGARHNARPPSPRADFNLKLAAPPRPDLEGVV